jgi:hypothetical protein
MYSFLQILLVSFTCVSIYKTLRKNKKEIMILGMSIETISSAMLMNICPSILMKLFTMLLCGIGINIHDVVNDFNGGHKSKITYNFIFNMTIFVSSLSMNLLNVYNVQMFLTYKYFSEEIMIIVLLIGYFLTFENEINKYIIPSYCLISNIIVCNKININVIEYIDFKLHENIFSNITNTYFVVNTAMCLLLRSFFMFLIEK